MRQLVSGIVLGLALALPAHAQETPGEALEALYEAISGPVGEARDWERFRSLFLPGAQMSVVVTDAAGNERVVVLTVEDYIERNGERLAEIGFTETETRRETFLYGGMATILSAYEAIRADTGETIAVGVNSLTILNDQGTWKIASIAWRSADETWPVERAFERAE